MNICAHRCRGFGYPENSVRAIRAALQSGVDAIELDVRLTSDLKWVALYKDGLRQVQRVHERTLSQVKQEIVPLDTVFSLFAGLGEGKELFLDIRDIGEERQLLRMLDRHGLRERTIAVAWEPEILRSLHRLAPSLRLGMSYVPIQQKEAAVAVHRPLGRNGVLLRFNELHTFDTRLSIGRTHQHYLSELPDLPLYSIQVFSLFCSGRLVQEAHAKGLQVYAFVVNNRLSMSLLKKRAVDGILTDNPLLFLE